MKKSDRRGFLKTSATTAAGVAVMSALPKHVLGANDRLRVAQIGCGGRGNYLIGEVFKSAKDQNVEIAALCDVWSVNLDRAVARVDKQQGGKVKTYRRYSELLQSKDIDAILIATPDFGHTPIMIEAMKAGKDVFCEKPMSTELAHANEALRVQKQTGRIVQVGSQRRSDPRHQAGAKLIQSGILGKITEVETAWHDNAPRWARDYSDVRREDVDWDQYLMYLPKEPWNPARFRRWHLYKDFTTGTPALLGAHLIDVGVWFMDDPLPTSAVAHGGVYVWKDGREHADTMEALLEYPKGFLLKYATRLGNAHPVPEAVFFGTKGTFDTESWTARGDGGGKDKLSAPVTVPKPEGSRTFAAGTSNPGTNMPGAAGSTAGTGTQTMLDERVAGEGHVKNWLECVRSRKQPNAPIDVGYAHSVASILCFKAWLTGRRQVFDAGKSEITAA
jgi:predicted dehydrogenase